MDDSLARISFLLLSDVRFGIVYSGRLKENQRCPITMSTSTKDR